MNCFAFPDCLVLKLEEICRQTKQIDTTVYILYDSARDNYLIRGRRKWTHESQSCEYSYDATNSEFNVANFLQYIICRTNTVNETLYNYDNLPNDSNKITFEFLHNYYHSDYEISGYDNKKLHTNRLIKNLRMLRTINNKY